jgi:hypothetical protein
MAEEIQVPAAGLVLVMAGDRSIRIRPHLDDEVLELEVIPDLGVRMITVSVGRKDFHIDVPDTGFGQDE